MIPIEYYIALSATLFTIGGVGFLTRRNVIVTLMSIEIMLNAGERRVRRFQSHAEVTRTPVRCSASS